MKLLSFVTPKTNEKTWGCMVDNKIYDLMKRCNVHYPDLKSVLAKGGLAQLSQIQLDHADYNIDEIHFLPVIENPGKIFCAGMNYKEKRIEFDQSTNAPTLFIRFPDSLVAHKELMMKPISTDEFDYEGELAVVIGKTTSNISWHNALDYVAGYSCFMDGSVRDMQYTWFTSGKNWPKTGAFGPWLVTSDEISDPQDLNISTWLNGNKVQYDSTGNMIYSIACLIAYISKFSKLEAGDVIITGSPGGVGKKRTPPLFMKEGDTIEVEISKIGRLANKITTHHLSN